MLNVELRENGEQKPLWEQNVLQLVGQIRDKPKWWEKFRNEEIIKKWKQEVLELCKTESTPGMPRYRFLGDQIDETFAAIKSELEYDDAMKDLTWPFLPGPSRDIFYADNIVSEKTKKELQRLVFKYLEDVPSEQVDWHPGSDNQVRDLVHPSLYPLKYGYTYGNHEDGTCKPIEKSEALEKKVTSTIHGTRSGSSFQWLPSVFNIEKQEKTSADDNDYSNGYKVEIASYINNLHPVICKELYPLIEKVFAAAIPGLNYVLSNAQEEDPTRSARPDLSNLTTKEYRELFDKYIEEDEDEELDLLEESKEEYLKPFDTLGWKPLAMPPQLSNKFRAENFKSLKVITKLANIELTPENPNYSGGSWHLEGTAAEDIVATVLYYYDSENITESRLSFRGSVDEDLIELEYEQNDFVGVYYAYGYENEQHCVFNMGSVQCKEDRVLVFPNMVQHHVDQFKLADPAKPGHRKILCFFICNPGNEDVWATDKVPYQNRDWVRNEISSNNNGREGLDQRLPPEIIDCVLEKTALMDWKLATENREKLMEERSSGDLHGRSELFTAEFSLCEH